MFYGVAGTFNGATGTYRCNRSCPTDMGNLLDAHGDLDLRAMTGGWKCSPGMIGDIMVAGVVPDLRLHEPTAYWLRATTDGR